MIKKITITLFFIFLFAAFFLMYGSLTVSMLSTRTEVQPFLLRYFTVQSPVIPLEVVSTSKTLWGLTCAMSVVCSLVATKKRKVGIK